VCNRRVLNIVRILRVSDERDSDVEEKSGILSEVRSEIPAVEEQHLVGQEIEVEVYTQINTTISHFRCSCDRKRF
jgi:hypothetical protein